MAAELDAHHALFQLPHRYSHRHLYHEQRGITEPIAAQDHQNPRRLPQRRSRTEVAVLGPAPSGEEVDHADSSWARSAESLYDFVAGAHARPGKGGIMNHRLLHGWAREEALPLPSRTHPQNQKQTSAVYTKELTDLKGLDTPDTPGRELHGLVTQFSFYRFTHHSSIHPHSCRGELCHHVLHHCPHFFDGR